MAEMFSLQPNESVIDECDEVRYGGIASLGRGRLILTNLNIIYVSTNMLGKTNNVLKFPLSQLKNYKGEPQAIMGKQINGSPQLELYFVNGQQANFSFMLGKTGLEKKKICTWINEICELVTGHESSSVSLSKLSAIPGTEFVAATLKGTVDTFKDKFGGKSNEQIVHENITKKCISCSAPLNGIKGQTIHCRYCDTDQVL